MTRTKLTIMLAAVATLSASVATAGQIYRFVDEDGNIHYVDRPTGVESEERLAIASARTDNAAVMARVQERQARSTPAAADDAAAVSDEPIEEDVEMTRAERIAEARERQQKCQQYRSRLETFVTARRLYREGEDGAREYLDDSEIQEARESVQGRIEEYCN